MTVMRDNAKRRGRVVYLMVLFTLLASSAVQAEPPIHLSPRDFLGLFSGRSVSEPIKVQAACSAEIGACWKAHGLNRENRDQVSDVCWKEARKCPKVCRDEYFSRRQAGMGSEASDPLFHGRRGEDTSCVPGVDELTHPSGKVKANDSEVRVSVTLGGRPAGADVTVIPVDEQGHEIQQTTSSPSYSKGTLAKAPPGPISLYLPAGRYRLRVLSKDRFYHRTVAFPEQSELVTVQSGQTLERTYAFGMGRLVVKAQNGNGQPVAATLELRRSDRPDYVLLRKNLPLDEPLLAHKYRLVISDSRTLKSQSLEVEVTDRKLTTRTITFDGR